MATQQQTTIALVLYPGITLLDLVGPLQVFSVLRTFDDRFQPAVVAERLEPNVGIVSLHWTGSGMIPRTTKDGRRK